MLTKKLKAEIIEHFSYLEAKSAVECIDELSARIDNGKTTWDDVYDFVETLTVVENG
jgi:hypothetical protein